MGKSYQVYPEEFDHFLIGPFDHWLDLAFFTFEHSCLFRLPAAGRDFVLRISYFTEEAPCDLVE